jgi:cytochrome c oxidase subunit II
MKNRKWVALFLLVMVMGARLARLETFAAEKPRVIPVTAKRFEFSPNLITLKKGESVTLRFTSEDVTHGLYQKALKIDDLIEPGKMTDVTIKTDTPGSFTTICDHFCGVGHAGMKMTIVVE